MLMISFLSLSWYGERTMNRKKSPQQNRLGLDRFGYRPTPATRVETGLYPYEQGQRDRQDLLDKIRFDRLEKTWKDENAARGRHGWEKFGNKELPINNYKHDIMKMVDSNRISLLKGETGSGKSTQLAQYGLEMGYDHIVYLQPRRVTVDNISERIDEELSEQFAQKGLEKPEDLVGMAHSERATMTDDSVIQVMTSAVFKKRGPELQDEWRDKKVMIVADEIHEANIETEFAVAMSAEMMTEQPNWNMVLMSATMNEDDIQQAYAPINGGPIPNVEVEGRPHEIAYHEEPDKNVIDVFGESCYEQGNKTLIFTEGKRSLGAIENALRREHPDLRILKLHSKITDEERHAIFHEDVEDQHTVIVSTSAGQSGLTIPGVDRVISDGMTKSPELDDESASGLPSRLCSKAEITQQMGRGGRDIEGAHFFLATQLPFKRGSQDETPEGFVPFHERIDHSPADIYHTVITRNVLSAAAMDRDFYNLNSYLINSVSHGTIREAYEVLKMLGAVNKDNQCTPIGKQMDMFPLRPELSRAMVAAMQTATDEQKRRMAAIATAVEAGGLGDGDPKKIEKNNKELPLWANDDFIAELVYFQELLRVDESEDDNEVPVFDFDHVNAKRALKQYRKMCYRLGLDESADALREGHIHSEDVAELRNMLVKGMPHLLYEEVGRYRHRGRRKKLPNGKKEARKDITTYRNVLAPPKEVQPEYDYDRKISNRSRLAQIALKNSDLIAGYPRWYYDDEDNLHNVVEKGFPIDKRVAEVALGDVALSVQKSAAVGPDGRLRSTTSRRIGSLTTGQQVERASATTGERVEQLVEAALARPGSAQRELRKTKKELESLVGRIPHEYRSYYQEKPILTDRDFEALIYHAAQGVASTGELDSELRTMMYGKRAIYLNAFVTPEKQEDIRKNMPDVLAVGEQWCDVSYQEYDGPDTRLSSGKDTLPAIVPFISNFSLENAKQLPDHITIPDGREVMFRYRYDEGHEQYLTAAEFKRLAQQ